MNLAPAVRGGSDLALFSPPVEGGGMDAELGGDGGEIGIAVTEEFTGHVHAFPLAGDTAAITGAGL